MKITKKITVILLVISIVTSYLNVTAMENDLEPLVDPMILSDEYLYGVWDSENEVWTTEPQINYNFSDELNATELAVKDGDYQRAAQNLLNYYRNREYDFTQSPGGVRNALLVNMWCDNIFYWGDEIPVDVVELQEGKKWYSINVLSNVNSSIGTYMFFSRYKNDGTAYIFSKESEYAPYLKLKINGREQILYPSEDTMISAGLNKATNYGDEEELLVQDNADYGTNVWCDETTFRTYLRFPIESAIKKGANISEAKLCFYAKTETNGQKIVVATSALQAIDEHSLTWKKHTPSTFCYGTYSGWDDLGGVHVRFYPILYALNEYYYTKNEKFAYHSIRHIINFSKSGKLTSEGDLQIGMQLQKIAPSFVNFVQSPSMTPAAMNAWLKLMIMDGEFLYDDKNFTNDMNFGTNATRGYHTFLACIPEIAKYELWLDKVHEREIILVNNIVQDDGSYLESDYGYATTSFNLFADAHTFSLMEGFEFPEWWYEKWEKFAYYFLNSETPNKRLPDWGDNGMAAVPNLEAVAEIFSNKHFEYHATGGERGEKPDYTSVYFPNNHVGIMRDKFYDEDAVFAFVDNKQGGYHSHSEGIHFTIMAYGNYLLTDTGCTSYEKTHPHFYWQRFSTISHNSIDVNNGAANRAMISEEVDKLSDEEMYMNKLFDTFEAESVAFEEATHLRDITYIKPLGLFICSDLMKPTSEEENKYNQAWHTLADAKLTYNEESKAARTNFDGLANLQIVPLDPEELNLPHAINGTTEVLSDGYSYFDNINIRNCVDTKFVNYEKYSTTDTTFDTVLYPSKAEDATVISAERLDTNLERSKATAFRISFDDNDSVSEAYYMLNRESNGSFVQIPFGDFTSDGRMTYIEKNRNGNISNIMARDVSKIYYKGQLLLDLGDVKIEDVSITFNGSYIYIYGTNLNDIPINLYKIADTKAVFVNEVKEEPNIRGNCYLIGDDSVVYDSNINDEGIPEVLCDYLMLKNASIALEVEHGTKLSGLGWNYTLSLPKVSNSEQPNIGDCTQVDFSHELEADKPIKLTLNKTLVDKLYYKTNDAYASSYNNDDIRVETSQGNTIIYMSKLYDLAYTVKKEIGTVGGSSSNGSSSSSLSSNGGIYELKPENKEDEDVPKEEKRVAMFEDMVNHWAYDTVQKLFELGVVNGRTETIFDPESQVSRAEFAMMIKNALGLESNMTTSNYFTDVEDGDWFKDAVVSLSENEIMMGDNGLFRPLDAISREEAAATIVRSKEKSDNAIIENEESSFLDNNTISKWAKIYVDKSSAYNLMVGSPDGCFYPQNRLTRAEAAQVILNLIESLEIK